MTVKELMEIPKPCLITGAELNQMFASAFPQVQINPLLTIEVSEVGARELKFVALIPGTADC